MTDSRRQILAAIAEALAQGPAVEDASPSAPERAPVLPAAARLTGIALLEAFVAAVERSGATCEDVGPPAHVPEAVERYLRAANLPPRVRMGADPWLASLPWAGARALEVVRGPAEPADSASLSRAVAGVAETGTVLHASGADNPSTLVCLPEAHCIVVTRDRIVGAAEQAWRLMAGGAPFSLPRAVHWITGPSRTADIEQTLLMGAHGPRRLHVLIADPR